MKPLKVLIVTCSGGNGLLQAAQAKEDEVLAKNPDAIIIKRDTIMHWMGKGFGYFGRYLWNRSQKKGNVFFQVFLLKVQVIAEYIYTLNFFFYMFFLLMKEDVDRVIDTQIFGTAYFIKAIRLFNWIKNKNVFLEKVMIDLPTNKAEHFFGPIRRCTKKDKAFLKFITISPLLGKNETEEIFWKEKCKLSLSNIFYEPFIVRKSFKKFEHLNKCQDVFDLKISYSSQDEKKFIHESFSRGSVLFKDAGNSFVFHVDGGDAVMTILLGSQPSRIGTLAYLKKVLSLSRNSSQKTLLFIFCGTVDSKRKTLFSEICDFVKNIEDYPSSLSIIPFSYQSQENIAPLLYRSNSTITRSGGGTAMELLAIMHGQMFIHTEATGAIPSRKEILKGIPGHESGAAEYLEEKARAKIVNPELFHSYLSNP